MHRSAEITVVVGTYNGAKYLAQQLESIEWQTLLPREIVVSDDGSTDDTVDLLTAFARSTRMRVRLMCNANRGVGANFLAAVTKVDTPLVAFCDQDDVWHPAKLELMVQAIELYGAELAWHGATVVNEDLRPTRSSETAVRRPRCWNSLEANIWKTAPGNCMLFKRELLEGCPWMRRPVSQYGRGPMNHDDLVYYLGSIRGRLVRIPDRLILYRQHGRNVAGAPKPIGRALREQEGLGELCHHKADAAAEWAVFFSELCEEARRRDVQRYFAAAATVMRRREVRMRENVAHSVFALAGSVVRGDYSVCKPEGLGWLTFWQDLFWTALKFSDRHD